jgi:hypothetical protein
VNVAEGLRVECGHAFVIVHSATAIQNLQLAVFPDMKGSIPIVEAGELRLPLRLTLLASSHQRELKGSVQRHSVYNRSERKRLSTNRRGVTTSSSFGVSKDAAECQPPRGCGSAASTLAGNDDWKRPICAEARPFVCIAHGDANSAGH